MNLYRIATEQRADLDVRSAFAWYEQERLGLGTDLLDEIRATYDRVAIVPFGYQILGHGVRRARLRRFPYHVYFSVEGEVVHVIAVLHTSRDPAEWQAQEEFVIDIDALSSDEKLDLIERLWESLKSTHESILLSDAQREDLDRRLDELERDGPVGIPAEGLLARLRGRNE